ncbi:MAG: hypothetical protein ACREVB_11950, partial [Burkholderiales bacterium]
VLHNPGYAAHKPPAQAFKFQATSTSFIEEMERHALATAKEENAEQGIDAQLAFAAADPAAMRPQPARIEIVPPPRAPKKKRVARVQKPQPVPLDAWQPWGHAQQQQQQWSYAQRPHAQRQRGGGFFFLFQ